MARKLKFDRVLFVTTILLVAASVVMVYSASAAMAMEQYQQPNLFLTKQGLFALLGVAAMAIAMRVNYRVYQQPVVVWALALVTLVSLAAVLVFGPTINGTRRWFNLAGISIQPSEIAKLGVIVFTAAVLSRRVSRIDDVRYALTPIAVGVGLVLLLVMLEPDFGSGVAVLTIALAMVFVAGLPWKYLVGIGLALLPLMAAVAISAPYRLRRLMIFRNPWDDQFGDGFQVIQSMIAVGTGGLTGRGLGEGVQKLFFLPYPHTDFIYAVVAEELGLIGATAILACFCVITWRGLRVVTRAPDAFGSLLALGLTAMIGVQAFLNISIVLGLLPTKGLPLPFVSAGGSSLVVNLAGMGVLLNVSQHASAQEDA